MFKQLGQILHGCNNVKINYEKIPDSFREFFFIVFLIVKFESDNFGYGTDFLGR